MEKLLAQVKAVVIQAGKALDGYADTARPANECDLVGMAAGVLLVTEAGGGVTNLHGKSWQPGHKDILATAPGMHKELLALLQEKDVH